jgi:hypothetical protein
MGEMCRKVAGEIDAGDHIAVVEHPEDKRLRFPQLSDGPGKAEGANDNARERSDRRKRERKRRKQARKRK